MKWLVRVGMMETIPRGYGFAYHLALWAVCAPIPLNLVIGAWHKFSMWLRYRAVPQSKIESDMAAEYRRGYEAGRFSR